MRLLVTGTAGFIGYHLARRLLDSGHEVTGIDGFTPYYDVQLKERRHAQLAAYSGYRGHRMMLAETARLAQVWEATPFDAVVHLAAQAGVRYSMENPSSYIDANIIGTFNMLELARARPPKHFLMASTSSVYGANEAMPFHETDRTVHPMSLYAATKMATEHIAHSYSHLWSIPTTAFRFFTVYGPWGRPDMALFKFTRGILEGYPIDVYNHGKMERDFTYIDDLVEAVCRLIDLPPALPGTGRGGKGAADALLSPVAPFRAINVGGGQPTSLIAFIEAIERATGRTSERNYMPLQAGDVVRTYASADALVELTGYRPSTRVEDGIKAFVAWYRDYHKV
jgi:UDP-glucuronate 4-epimerase